MLFTQFSDKNLLLGNTYCHSSDTILHILLVTNNFFSFLSDTTMHTLSLIIPIFFCHQFIFIVLN